MASSLFPQHSSQRSTPSANPMTDSFNRFKQTLGANPQAVFNQTMQQNPAFREFVQNNQGKSIPEIAMEIMANRGGSALH